MAGKIKAAVLKKTAPAAKKVVTKLNESVAKSRAKEDTRDKVNRQKRLAERDRTEKKQAVKSQKIAAKTYAKPRLAAKVARKEQATTNVVTRISEGKQKPSRAQALYTPKGELPKGTVVIPMGAVRKEVRAIKKGQSGEVRALNKAKKK
jgi:hypothetical protein